MVYIYCMYYIIYIYTYVYVFVYFHFNQRKLLVRPPRPSMSCVPYVICCRSADDVRLLLVLFKYIIYMVPYAVAALLSYRWRCYGIVAPTAAILLGYCCPVFVDNHPKGPARNLRIHYRRESFLNYTARTSTDCLKGKSPRSTISTYQVLLTGEIFKV